MRRMKQTISPISLTTGMKLMKRMEFVMQQAVKMNEVRSIFKMKIYNMLMCVHQDR